MAVASALISMKAPHQIFSVNESFLQLLGYEGSELVGRGMRILHGPSTDPMVLKGAIKSVATVLVETVETTIHDKAGQGHHVIMTCSPWTKTGSDVMACLLQIKEVKAFLIMKLSLTPPSAPTPRVITISESSLRKSSRHSYNFMIGLDMHQNRKERKACNPDCCTEDEDLKLSPEIAAAQA